MTETSPEAAAAPEPEIVENAPTPENIANADTPTENEQPAAEEAAMDPMAAMSAEVDKWKDLAYRSQAELDNFRKRSAREAQETRAYANADLLRGILPIMDNFEMGLEAARAESEKSMIFMGMSMVQRQIADFLRDVGVTEVEALGKAFDPNLHDAVSQEASADVAEGTVLRVTRRGFKLKDRLLRPTSVIVSSGPAA
ncbi:MAG: nucleotide exchange factor GrpE [Verrucomicrobiaceae bacterium]|nr:nucleotide exchange factor GrpE [Verrucomicrobiaceae bacterium]